MSNRAGIERQRRLVTEYRDDVDRNLVGPEANFAHRNEELIRRHAERLAIHAIREVLRWVIVGDAPDVSNSSSESDRYCVERIGRRALSAAWVIDTGLLEGKSLRQISHIPAACSDVHRLSAHVEEFRGIFSGFARDPQNDSRAEPEPVPNSATGAGV